MIGPVSAFGIRPGVEPYYAAFGDDAVESGLFDPRLLQPLES
jgi:hypothetical protein